jgi:hypothetical protein
VYEQSKIFIQNVKKFSIQQKFFAFFSVVFDRTLEKDIVSDTSGHLKKLLIALVHVQRPESNEINEEQVKKDAKSLYEAGEKRWGTDESKFIQILCNRRLII